MIAKKGREQFRLVSMDINNNCNLRCKFCFNEFSDGKNVNMTRETLDKAFALLPLVSSTEQLDGRGMYFSCLYEPTLHPDFVEYLKRIPMEGKEKVFFTSNICKDLSDAEILAIRDANIHHMNISVETFNSRRYETICGAKRFESFYNNLCRIAACFSERENAPKLRYITMVLRENYDELLGIVERCHTQLHAHQSELRTPYEGGYSNMAWLKNQIPGAGQLRELEEALRALPYNILYCLQPLADNIAPPAGLPAESAPAAAGPAPKNRAVAPLPEAYADARVDSRGEVQLCGLGEAIPLADMPLADVGPYFEKKLQLLYQKNSARFLCPGPLATAALPSAPMQFSVDEFVEYSQTLSLRGWVGSKACSRSGHDCLLLVGEEDPRLFYTELEPRPDVQAAFGDEDYMNTGFRCLIPKSALRRQEEPLRFLLLDKNAEGQGLVSEGAVPLQLT